MFQFLLPILSAIGSGASAVGSGLGTLGSMAANGAGAVGSAMGSILPSAGAGAGASGSMSLLPTSGIGQAMMNVAPNLTSGIKSLAGGQIKSGLANLGTAFGGENLGNAIINPSMANLGELAKSGGTSLLKNSIFGGGQSRTRMRSQNNIQDPILQRMYNNLNQGQRTLSYPKKISSI